MKNVVIDHIPKKITGMEFSALTPTEIIQQSEVEVITRDLYDIEKPGRQAKQAGAIDTKMGVSSAKPGATGCGTCQGNLTECHGHFGHI